MNKNPIKPYQKSLKQIKFEKAREHYSEKDIQLEILYSNWVIQSATEKTRANTSVIVWIIVISIVSSVVMGVIPFLK